MKILVTGGAGFIGSHLVDKLLEKGHIVTCIDDFTLGSKNNLENALTNKNFQLEEFDLLNLDNLSKFFENKNFEFVYHLAANSDIQKGTESTTTDLEKTFMTTYNILESMRKNSVDKILFTSSSAIFGKHSGPIGENIALKPESLYGAGKSASESYIHAFCNLYDIKSWIVRLSNTVGKRLTHGVIFDFLNKIKENEKELKVLGDGKQAKPYMHVDDLIDCILFVINNTDEKINIFNVGPEDKITVEEIAKLIIEKHGNNQKISYTGGSSGWKGDIPIYSQNTKKIKSLGWEPRYNSEQAIIKALEDIEFHGKN
tara:strand:+ start:281 stop:1222 length:942 start_codon:yes stop_codon:yes gene_type:complete